MHSAFVVTVKAVFAQALLHSKINSQDVPLCCAAALGKGTV